MSTLLPRIVFTLSGTDGPELARALERAFARWLASPTPEVEELDAPGDRIRVVITGPTRETSMAHAVSFARSELEAGICEAGGAIWDRTHVLITEGSVSEED
ncbi:MAG: hypothetical protein IPK72_22600 [Candidatus Eisenbacteria bacterium]|nr:hypothetical protein [Candidatus Eisenbacteria bacterium]